MRKARRIRRSFFIREGNNHAGIRVNRDFRGFVRVVPLADPRLGRNDGGRAMNLTYLISGIVSLVLLAYLLVALLKPEKF